MRCTLQTRAALLLALWSSAAAAERPEPSERHARLVARGDLHAARGDTLTALGLYRDAITAAPRRGEGYAALGALYLRLSEPGRALEVFETGVRNAGQGEALWLGYAEALREAGEPERALWALRSLRTLEPESHAGLGALASALEQRGGYIEALSVRRKRVELLARVNAPELELERSQVRALEYLLGASERTHARQRCTPTLTSAVLRALAACPE